MALPGWKPIALAAALGMALSFPVSWLVARRIESLSA
jgi:predicted PurR-regulated permease PerM